MLRISQNIDIRQRKQALLDLVEMVMEISPFLGPSHVRDVSQYI